MKYRKNIAIFHYQTGHTDGVSLEINKWKQVLEEMGHSVFLCSGDLGSKGGYKIEELYHHLDDIRKIDRNSFYALNDCDNESLSNEIEAISKHIEEKLESFIREFEIELLIVNNIWSVGLNLPAALAIERVRKANKIPSIGHHHDFYWERLGGVSITCDVVENVLREVFPPRDLLIKHVVINSLAQKQLETRKRIKAEVVPNVFDFSSKTKLDKLKGIQLRKKIGLNPSDIFVLQATRIVPRKGIELAIDFINALNSPARRKKLITSGLYNGMTFTEHSQIVFVLSGYSKDDFLGGYLDKLINKAQRLDVRLISIEDIIAHSFTENEKNKQFSFWDVYAAADMVTYPSLWEGWGNQFLEALHAQLPVVLFEYPVYTHDLKDKGFEVISLGSKIHGYDSSGLAQVRQSDIENAADQAIDVLTDSVLRNKMVNHNHNLCKRYYSLDALKIIIAGLLENL